MGAHVHEFQGFVAFVDDFFVGLGCLVWRQDTENSDFLLDRGRGIRENALAEVTVQQAPDQVGVEIVPSERGIGMKGSEDVFALMVGEVLEDLTEGLACTDRVCFPQEVREWYAEFGDTEVTVLVSNEKELVVLLNSQTRFQTLLLGSTHRLDDGFRCTGWATIGGVDASIHGRHGNDRLDVRHDRIVLVRTVVTETVDGGMEVAGVA